MKVISIWQPWASIIMATISSRDEILGSAQISHRSAVGIASTKPFDRAASCGAKIRSSNATMPARDCYRL